MSLGRRGLGSTYIGVAACAAALALTAAACGGSSGSSAGGGKLTTVTLGYVPYADDAALFLAEENGIFRSHGLDVKFVPAANPTAVVASMLSGQEQFGFITTPVLANINAKGTPFKCVSSVDGGQPSNPAQDSTALVAAKGSGITSVKDLAGQNIGMVQLTSLNSLAIDVLAKQAGINPASIHQIVMPFPQMPAALSQGRVKAAVIVAPFVNTAIADGATVINHPNQLLFPNATVTCLDATGPYISQNPTVVSEFHAAMNQAITYSQAHPSQAKAALPKYMTTLTPQIAQKQLLSTNWNPVLSASSITAIETYMKEFGQLPRIVPASSMIWSGAG
jgi:NitT/TauT family transport system substrate-binding protein